MPTFRVPLTRDVTESTFVEVEADTPKQAAEKALEKAGSYGQSLSSWESDEGNFSDVYVPDEDFIEEVG